MLQECEACCSCQGDRRLEQIDIAEEEDTAYAPTVALTDAPVVSAEHMTTAVEKHGLLVADRAQIVDEAGRPVHLLGMSLLESSMAPHLYTPEAVHWLVKDWKINVVRASVAVASVGGFLDNPTANQFSVEQIVQAAIKLGIYVIIDWHDSSAESHIEQAKLFFRAMASKYGGHKNVIFEVYSQPGGQSWPTVIKPYHDELVAEIREYSWNLIILGTPLKSTRVGEASLDPVAGDNMNVAYALQFFAATPEHQEPLRLEARTAMRNGVAIFVSQWGACEADGAGAIDVVETERWLRFLKEWSIPSVNGALHDGVGSCAALEPGANPAGNWSVGRLTQSGTFVRNVILGLSTAGSVFYA